MAVLFTNEADELKIFFKIIRFRRIILCDMKHLMTWPFHFSRWCLISENYIFIDFFGGYLFLVFSGTEKLTATLVFANHCSFSSCTVST